MKPRTKYGLIVGAVGLVLNVCISAAVGLCGPVAALVAGIVATLLAAREENPASKGEAAQMGAISGAIAGGLMVIGQLLGGLVVLFVLPVMVRSTGRPLIFGTLPAASDSAGQVAYWISGLGAGLCFGIVGVVLSTLAGVATGYLAFRPGTTGMPQQPSM